MSDYCRRVEYRRVTLECAGRDWAGCRRHDDVIRLHAGEDLIRQFERQNTATWYTQAALRERTRDAPARGPRPGTRPIGQCKVTGFRSWIWKDDGSVFDLDGFDEADINWMIAYGNRRRGDRSDLQVSHAFVLHDPEDSWRPVKDDYVELLHVHNSGFTDRAANAVAAAIEEAEMAHNTVVPIVSPELDGTVIQEHDHEEDLEGVVIVEINELWVILKNTRPNGRFMTYEDAITIAGLAFPEGVEPQIAFEDEQIRGGLYSTDPATEWVIYGELPD